MNRLLAGRGELAFQTAATIISVLAFIVCIYPFYYIFLHSVSDPMEAQKGLTLLPRGLTADNYIRVFRLEGIAQAALVSVLRTVIGTVLTVLCCSLFAYIVTKERLYFRKTIYRFLVVTMYFNSGLIPWYLTMKMLHLNDTFLLYVLPSAISAFNVILLKTFIEQLPQALEESAQIDGAGYLTVFARIVFPLSAPILATIAVFSAVAQWNTWFDNFFLVQNPQLRTLQLILYDYLNDANRIASLSMEEMERGLKPREVTPQSVQMTITMVVTFPVLFVYPFMQKYFVKGIMVGAIKG